MTGRVDRLARTVVERDLLERPGWRGRGRVVVALVGGAAESGSAIAMARKNKLDLTVGTTETYARIDYLRLNRNVDRAVELLEVRPAPVVVAARGRVRRVHRRGS